MKRILECLEIKQDHKIEEYYFKKDDNDLDIFYPWGFPGSAYHVTENQKRKFIHLITSIIILFMFTTASLIYPFEISKYISVFGLIVITLNAGLLCYWLVPRFFVHRIRADPVGEAQYATSQPRFVDETFKNITIQAAVIVIGLTVNNYNVFLWASGIYVILLALCLLIIWTKTGLLF